MRKYQIRKAILTALKSYRKVPTNVGETMEHPVFMRISASLDEVRNEWDELEALGYIKACEGFNGEYCRVSDKGVQQLSPEFKKDAFIHGPYAAG